jgi:exonuclease III/ribonuclease HI
MNTTTASRIMMSSTSCGPFLEENVVSGRVDKSIYAKDQDYDSQTQRTEQTMKPSATVRTEYTASAFTEDLQLPSVSTTSSHTEEITCFNKFFKYHNIPLLNNSQTLESVIQYLNYNNFTLPYKISINFTKTETHIYTNNNESLLPNHTLLQTHEQQQYYKLPIRSYNTNSSLHPLSLNNTSNLDSLKICSLNTNGLSSYSKQTLIHNFIIESNTQIFGLSETHLKKKDAKFLELSKGLTNYTNYWSEASNFRQGGVGIYVHNNISKFISKVYEYEGYILSIDFSFQTSPIRLIQIYFPTQEKHKLRKEIFNQITSLIQSTNKKIILMGDLNSTPNPKIDRLPPKKSHLPESQLIKFLKPNFYDTYRLFHSDTNKYSCFHKNCHSRIDQIWTNLHITLLDYADILDTIPIDSDHNIILLEINFSLSLTHNYKQPTRTKILWKNSTKQQIAQYQNHTNENFKKIEQNIIKIQNQNDLNTIWNIIKKSFLKASKKYIPYKKIKHSTSKTPPKPKSSPIQSQYQALIKIRKSINQTNFQTLFLNYHSKFQHNTNIPPNLLFSNNTDKSILIQTIKKEIQSLKLDIEQENKNHIQTEIQQKLLERNQNFSENPKLFYKKVLERFGSNANIDRLLSQDTLLTNPNDIKLSIQQHFQNYFSDQPLPPITPESEFYTLYQPNSSMESHYQDLLTEISQEEWLNIINQLPNQKSAGPSGINYEHIKYLSQKSLSILRKFISKCLALQQIPSEWKTSNIFLIPKKSQWDYTLDQVRPISLIEPLKKCLTKVFTKRLDHIINKNNLLSNLNFAATSNSSTHIPIQILNNTIEHYKQTNQEAWILFQDMSKAFDKININRLADSCKRIGMPQTSINFITNLHQDRKACIITAYGLTEPINLLSGIEQGETYSPLLWKIYYDPILFYINNKYQDSFLKIQSLSPIEQTFQTNSLPTIIPPLAFMDDTVWHCKNSSSLQQLLNDVNKLYQLNNIQINPSKSDLLHIIPKKSKTSNSLNQPQPQLKFNNISLLPRKPTDTIRYLGIYFDGLGSAKPTIDLISQKLDNFLKIIQFKKLLPLQITRLFNTILAPTIEYLLQIVPLTNKKITKLSTVITKQFKHILHLSSNTNNDILSNPLLLNLPTIKKLLIYTSCNIIEKTVNSSILLKQIFEYRIKEWLSKIWYPTISKEIIQQNKQKLSNFTCITHLLYISNYNININNLNINISNTLNNTKTNLIYNFLPPNPNSSTIQSLKNNRILFLEQILTANNSFLLPWKNIYLRTNKTSRGRIPSWYTKLNNSLNNNSILTVWPQTQTTQINPFINTLKLITTPTQISLKNNWTILKTQSQIHIGKITFSNSNNYLFQHFTFTPNTTGYIILTPSNQFSQILPSSTINFTCKSQKEKLQYKISIDYKEILALSQLHPLLYHPIPLTNPQILIQNPICEQITNSIQTKSYQLELIDLYHKLLNTNSLNNLHFYTDASIQNLRTPNIKSGIGWILENNTHIKFNANSINTHNSTRVELEPVIYILLIIPNNLHIHIHMDNLSAIQAIKKLPYTHPTQIKNENWDILHIINYLLKNKNITLILHKIKSHSKNSLHQNADLLAKRGTNHQPLILNLNFFNPPIFFSWHNYLIPTQIRKFCKNIILTETINHFLQLRNINNIPQFDLNLFFNIINSQNLNLYLYSFRLKILLNNLPTVANLNLRLPLIYLTPNCSRCNSPENLSHLLQCSQTQNLTQTLIQSLTQILSLLNINNISPQDLLSIILPQQNNNSHTNTILYLIQGTFPTHITTQLHSLLLKKTSTFCIQLSNSLLEWFNQKIWQPRNTYQHNWETLRNITNKSKRTKKTYTLNLTITSIQRQNPTIFNNNIDTNIQKWFIQNYPILLSFI